MRLEVIDNHRSRFEPIPEGWHQRKMRFAVKQYQTKKNVDENPTVLSLTKTGLKVKTDLSFGKSTENYVGHQLVGKGQFVFTPRDFDATPILCGVADKGGCISNLYIVFDISHEIYGRFLEYYFWGLKYGFDFFEKLSFGMRYSYNRTQFENIPLLQPDLDTQKAIADFLDRETDRIDQLIEKKNLMASLIDERSKNRIANLVTGRESEGGATKDSGLHWCPKIPEHWQIRKGFHLGKIIGSIAGTEIDSQEGSIPYIKVNDLNMCDSGNLSSTSSCFVPASNFVGHDSDYLVFPKRGGAIFTNKVAIAPACSAIDPNIMGWQIFKSFQTDFVLWLLKTRGLDDLADISTVPQINNKHIYPEKFPVPGIEEQEKIVRQIGEVRQEADQLAAKVRSSALILSEFRSALITAAVTGQIDVATWGKQGQIDRRLDEIEEAMQA